MARLRGPLTGWTVVVLILVALLPVFAVLQYEWIGQVSEAERVRMRSNLRNSLSQFARDFNSEVTRLYRDVQLEIAAAPDGPTESREDHLIRLFASGYPKLVKQVYIARVDDSGDLTLLAAKPSEGRLSPVEWPSQLAPVRRRLLEIAGRNQRERQGGGIPMAPMLDDVPALVVPLIRLPPEDGRDFGGPGNRRMPGLAGYVVVELSADTLSQEFFPELVRKHFAERKELPYQVAVVSRRNTRRVLYESEPGAAEAASTAPDASTELLAIRPSGWWPGPGASTRERRGQDRGQDIEDPGPRERRSPESAGRGAFRRGGFGMAAAPPSGSGEWEVLARHRGGSLEALVERARWRNLAVSFGVLILLGVSLTMIVISTRRANRLAAQQMDFVAGVSHELRTPLSVICSAAENLADGVVNDRRQIAQYGGMIRSEGRRLSEMVDHILLYAARGSNHKNVVVRPVDVRSLIDASLAAASGAFLDAGVEVTTEFPPDLPPALADPAALSKCLDNLFSNAVKYAKESGWVGVRAQARRNGHGDEIEIRVEDKGPGIDPHELARIFEPFYRGGRAVAAQIHGTGLGLSLVKRMMEDQGGRVEAQSTPGQGSVFCLYLPVGSSS